MQKAATAVAQLAPEVDEIAHQAQQILSAMEINGLQVLGGSVTDVKGPQMFETQEAAAAYSAARTQIVTEVAQQITTLDTQATQLEQQVQVSFVASERLAARNDASRTTIRREGSDGEGSSGTPGTAPSNTGLGEPSVGTTPPTEPTPPPFTPPDKGAGPYDNEDPELQDYGTKYAAEAAANALSLKWPHAADNLLHFLGNSGKAKDQDVDAMLRDCAELRAKTHSAEMAVASQAVESAKKLHTTQPLTFPVSTPWRGHYIDPSESPDWFYATGGMQYNRTGYVTVYPPKEKNGKWRYEVSTRVNVRDQYNWDGKKSTEILGMTVTDEQLARLHRSGLAREYTLKGQGSKETLSGELP